MASTIGQQLRTAREGKELSIQDVAHETRIRANQIRALESDDYSGFASITYAKSFLQKYSRYVDVDPTETLSSFYGDSSINLHGSSLLTELPETIDQKNGASVAKRKVKRKYYKGEKPGGAPVFLGVVLAILLIAIPTFYFLGYNAEDPNQVGTKIVENAEQIKKNLKAKAEKSNGTSKIQENPITKVETPATRYTKPKPEVEEPKVVVVRPKEDPGSKTKPVAKISEILRPKGEPNNPIPSKPEKPATPIRAVPIRAIPIAPEELQGTNEEPDALPDEEVVPEPDPDPVEKPRELNFDPGANRFPRRP